MKESNLSHSRLDDSVGVGQRHDNQYEEHQTSTSQAGAIGGMKPINLLQSAMVYNIDLETALSSIGFSTHILSDLDESFFLDES